MAQQPAPAAALHTGGPEGLQQCCSNTCRFSLAHAATSMKKTNSSIVLVHCTALPPACTPAMYILRCCARFTHFAMFVTKHKRKVCGRVRAGGQNCDRRCKVFTQSRLARAGKPRAEPGLRLQAAATASCPAHGLRQTNGCLVGMGPRRLRLCVARGCVHGLQAGTERGEAPVRQVRADPRNGAGRT